MMTIPTTQPDVEKKGPLANQTVKTLTGENNYKQLQPNDYNQPKFT